MATRQLNRLTGLLTAAYSANRLADELDADLLDRCRAGADPAAFEAIVRRHGNRVLAACRKVLSDAADVDDAFQATFLTLLRNPQAVRKAESLGAWLYGVAHRIAVRARDTANRRKGLLRNAPLPVESDTPDLSWKEACVVLHSELDRLPDSLRLPLVLCYLDGLSRDEAAAQLGWSLNEVRGRLERGRDRLRKRLEKRGIALSAGLLAAVAGNSVTAGVPPTRLIEIAMRAASGHPSAAAASLAHGVHPAMIATFKYGFAFVLAAGVLIGVGLQRPDVQAGPRPTDAKSAQAAGPRTSDPSAPPEFAGRVVDADGKPVTGAKLYVLYYTPEARPVPERATTDADGKFRFAMKAEDFERSYVADPWKHALLLAKADGYAVGWEAPGTGSDGPTIRITKDDKPLTGRLVNLEGKPVVGVTVRLTELQAPLPGKSLDGFAAELKRRKAGFPVLRDRVTGFEGTWIGRDLATLVPPVQTDKDGRFTIKGVGAERVATIRFDSPLVEGVALRVLTRESEMVTVGEWERPAMMGPEKATMTFVGNDFSYALAPGRTVTGVVKDKATGKPIPGARVESEKVAGHPVSGRFEFQAVADKDGRFTLHGLPLGRGDILRAAPPAGQPYLMQVREVPVPAGTNPAPLDFELARGIELTVQVTDAATKGPVAGWVEYFTFRDNPALKDVKGFTVADRRGLDSTDGVFRLVVPAGPGLVAFRSRVDRYPVSIGLDQFKDRMSGPFIDTIPHLCHPPNFTALAPVEPKADARAAEVSIELDAGKRATIRVLGPDGKPLAGMVARGLQSGPQVFGVWEREPLKGSEFEAVGLDPKRSRAVVFLHKEKKLAGSVRVTGTEKGPVEVTLRPWATLSGRLVDADGRPQADVRLSFVKNPDDPDPDGVGDLPDYEIKTDAGGRFRVSGFAPGLRYHLAAIAVNRVIAKVADGTQFKEGEEKDVGDVVVKPVE